MSGTRNRTNYKWGPIFNFYRRFPFQFVQINGSNCSLIVNIGYWSGIMSIIEEKQLKLNNPVAISGFSTRVTLENVKADAFKTAEPGKLMLPFSNESKNLIQSICGRSGSLVSTIRIVGDPMVLKKKWIVESLSVFWKYKRLFAADESFKPYDRQLIVSLQLGS